MNKRLVWLIALVWLVGGILAGCSNNDGSATKGKGGSSSSQSGGEEAVITVWSRDDVFKGDASPGMAVVKEFNERYAGEIRVDVVYMPQETYNPSIQAAISSNDLPDIFVLGTGMDLQTIYSNNVLLPLNDIVSDNWVKQFGDGSFMEGINVFDGNIYSYPFFGPEMTNIMYYNPDVLKAAGLDPNKPPTTWAELREMARQVTERGNGDVYGVVWPGADGDNYYMRIVHGLTADVPQATGGFDYATGKYNYNSDANKETIRFLLDLKQDGSIMPSTYTSNNSEARSYFAQGKAAFLFDFRSVMSVMKRDYPDVNFALATAPTKSGGKQSIGYSLASSKYAVAATTKYPQQVGKFLEEAMASKPFYERIIKTGLALTPFDNLNRDESLHGYPQFKQFYQVHTENMRIYPNVIVRNIEMMDVVKALGGWNQSKISPNFNELIEKIIITDNKDNIMDGLLDDYTQKLNDAMAAEIAAAAAAGKNVSMDTLVFPNWDPYKDYVADDYSDLK